MALIPYRADTNVIIFWVFFFLKLGLRFIVVALISNSTIIIEEDQVWAHLWSLYITLPTYVVIILVSSTEEYSKTKY